ncbi:hypothetical protein JOF35_007580 [Streptomyces demainii]|uniref:Uncharacterized protein n=1 Tax=Streptomyces demainii TaxID=588122 RepID=A0ABT9L3F3_9ACTN|nr:hypothetical protein [Streptomyces demainii]
MRWEASSLPNPGARPTSSRAARTGSPIAGSLEVCTATVFSTVTGASGAIGTARVRTAALGVSRCPVPVGRPWTARVRAAMATRTSEVVVRQLSHTVSGPAAAVRRSVRWQPASAS